jgi:hypothetical protein
MQLVVACNSSELLVQLHLNFKWFSITSITMVWLVVLSSFKMDDFYTLIYANMLLCIQFYIYFWFWTNMLIYIQYHIYIWFCTNMLSKNLSFKTQFGCICLNQTMIPFISKLFKTNLNNFCGFGCVRCGTTKCFMKLKNNRTMTKNLVFQIKNWFY